MYLPTITPGYMATTTKKIGKYQILDVLGKGGMGVVYKAVDPAIGRLVAIKMITSNYAEDPGFLKRFYREAQSTGKLQHQNIVIVHDLGEHEGNPFLVMEFLEGESLGAIIKQKRPVPIIDKLNYMVQVCNGLHYAHSCNIVHRDIKPGNLMVLKGSNIMKIVDFGIARIQDEANITQQSQVIGTIQYMSPEQINGRHVDGRSDVFSTAVVLYELLTYKLPFEGKDTGSTLLKIINEPPPPLGNFVQNYPPELDEVINRGLAKSCEDRYQTAEEFAFDLSQVLDQLRREAVSDYLIIAEDLLAKNELGKAREQCLQILRVDRQNSRARDLMQEVQRRLQQQQRDEQARQLRAHAQEAFTLQEFDRALSYLDQALELDSRNHDVQLFRESVLREKTRLEQCREAVKRAQSAQYAGDLTDAFTSIEQALKLDPADAEARALRSEIVRDIEQRKRQSEVQALIEEAQRQISSRQFTNAIQALEKAQVIDPGSRAIRELMTLAASGREQERRRKEIDRLVAAIQDALNHDNFAAACQRADEAVNQFPEDRALLKLKAMAERQRQAWEKRQYIETQIAEARKLLDNKQTDAALSNLRGACERFPNEPALLSVLHIVQQTQEQEQVEARKNDYVQKAKEALRNKRFDEAIDLLQVGFAELQAPELEDLLHFAQEEKAAEVQRERVDATAQDAHRLIAADEYEEAITLLRTALQESSDEDLQIILAEAEGHLQDFERRVTEAVDSAERLLRVDRAAEAVRFLASQPQTFSKSPRFREIVGRARDCQDRLRSIASAVEQARDAVARRDWQLAEDAIEQCRVTYGDHPDLARTGDQIKAGRREDACVVVNKVLNDCRMLLMTRSYESAVELLASVGPELAVIPEDLRLRHTAMQEEAERGASRLRRVAQHGDAQTIPAATTEDTDQRTVWAVPGASTHPAQPEAARAGDLEELNKLSEEAATELDMEKLRAISGRARFLAERNAANAQLQASAAQVSNTVVYRLESMTQAAPATSAGDVTGIQGPATFAAQVHPAKGDTTPQPPAAAPLAQAAAQPHATTPSMEAGSPAPVVARTQTAPAPSATMPPAEVSPQLTTAAPVVEPAPPPVTTPRVEAPKPATPPLVEVAAPPTTRPPIPALPSENAGIVSAPLPQTREVAAPTREEQRLPQFALATPPTQKSKIPVIAGAAVLIIVLALGVWKFLPSTPSGTGKVVDKSDHGRSEQNKGGNSSTNEYVELNPLPWAEVIRVKKSSGEVVDLPQVPGQTPIRLWLPPGSYSIDIKGPNNMLKTVSLVLEPHKPVQWTDALSGFDPDKAVDELLK